MTKHKSEMTKKLTAAIALALPLWGLGGYAQNDATAPLHLMKPAYRIPYGVPKAEDVKATMDRVKNYLDATTYMELDETGKMLRRGTFRLTSYEWGVTYSAMLRAGEVTGDASYTRYAIDRMEYLARLAPDFKARLERGEEIDPLMHQVVKPEALDDAGAICAAMLKAKDPKLSAQIETYYDFIANKQYRYKDGMFARLRPVKNTVWLDDMFMGIPALALHGDIDEALRQFQLFHDKMWVEDKHLYRHGWVAPLLDGLPLEGEAPQRGGGGLSFFWGRANGWALLTACELLDVKESTMVMTYFKEHLDGLLPLQHHDGAWHQLLDRPDTYLETSCTAIYCYCITHAINKGWIDAETYGAQALLAWNYVNAHVNQQGQVEGTCVGTGLAFDPAFYAYRPVNNFAAHGYGPTLWAGAEIYQLVKTHHIKLNDSAVHFYPEDPGTDEPIFYVKP
ncbi:MAG: glycoside hydrolase family 88 protein [Bacteroidaceae bacterium]|nr:glycoside hydrolase family 88 protein [Bacteroidaceae bacterium]